MLLYFTPIIFFIIGILYMILINRRVKITSPVRCQDEMRHFIKNEVPELKGQEFSVIGLAQKGIYFSKKLFFRKLINSNGRPNPIFFLKNFVVAYNTDGLTIRRNSMDLLQQKIIKDPYEEYDDRGDYGPYQFYISKGDIAHVEWTDKKIFLHLKNGECFAFHYMKKDFFGVINEESLCDFKDYLTVNG